MSKEYTVREVSDILKIYPETITRFIREGMLKGTKRSGVWKIMESDLKSFVEENDDHYGAIYRAYKKHLEIEQLKETDPKKYYGIKLKRAMHEIEMMHEVLDRYYKKLQTILDEEEP